MPPSQLAAQLYTLREFTKTPADIASTMKRVKPDAPNNTSFTTPSYTAMSSGNAAVRDERPRRGPSFTKRCIVRAFVRGGSRHPGAAFTSMPRMRT